MHAVYQHDQLFSHSTDARNATLDKLYIKHIFKNLLELLLQLHNRSENNAVYTQCKGCASLNIKTKQYSNDYSSHICSAALH